MVAGQPFVIPAFSVGSLAPSLIGDHPLKILQVRLAHRRGLSSGERHRVRSVISRVANVDGAFARLGHEGSGAVVPNAESLLLCANCLVTMVGWTCSTTTRPRRHLPDGWLIRRAPGPSRLRIHRHYRQPGAIDGDRSVLPTACPGEPIGKRNSSNHTAKFLGSWRLFRLRPAGRSSSYIRGHGSLSGIPSDPSPHQRDHCGHRDQRQTHYRRESVDKQDEVDGVLA
jgi:hypothetical protein